MVIKNAKVNGKLNNIVIKDGKITLVSEDCLSGEAIDAGGFDIIPGLIDVHTHGIMGYDTMDADFKTLCRYYAKFGTTSFLPTTMTLDISDLEKVTNAKTDFSGAQVLGFHLEGPYISKKYKGAQNEKYIRIPSVKEFESFKNVSMITIAPEVENGIDFIKKVSKNTVVSIGHTDCDYETALKAMESGAKCLTHTFNAMPPLHHRAPGPIGAAAEKGIYAQIICDGLHIAKGAVIAAYKMFGSDRMCLISDSIRPAKMPEGEYESGGLQVFARDNSIRLKDGTIAGSYACLLDCVKKAIEFGISRDEAIKMATQTPANLLGVKKGKIAAGYDADLLIVDEFLNIQKVIIGGKIFE